MKKRKIFYSRTCFIYIITLTHFFHLVSIINNFFLHGNWGFLINILLFSHWVISVKTNPKQIAIRATSKLDWSNLYIFIFLFCFAIWMVKFKIVRERVWHFWEGENLERESFISNREKVISPLMFDTIAHFIIVF